MSETEDKIVVPADKPEITKKVKVDLEVDTSVIWYMNLPAPTMEQSGLISIVVGAGAAWFGLYTGSSKKIK